MKNILTIILLLSFFCSIGQKVENTYPCLDALGQPIQGCYQVSDNAGGWHPAYVSKSYCEDGNVMIPYLDHATNSLIFVDTLHDACDGAELITADADGVDGAGNVYSDGDDLLELIDGTLICVEKPTTPNCEDGQYWVFENGDLVCKDTIVASQIEYNLQAFNQQTEPVINCLNFTGATWTKGTDCVDSVFQYVGECGSGNWALIYEDSIDIQTCIDTVKLVTHYEIWYNEIRCTDTIKQTVLAFPFTEKEIITFIGESNSGGSALNTGADPNDLGVRPEVSILNNQTLLFEDLDIGVNNLLLHPLKETDFDIMHGWELGLANMVEEGCYPEGQVCLLKTGAGGANIDDWADGGQYMNMFEMRWDAVVDNFKESCNIPKPKFWMSIGINNAIQTAQLTTNERDSLHEDFKIKLIDWQNRIRDYTGCPDAEFIMTSVTSEFYPQGTLLSDSKNGIQLKLQEIAMSDPNVQLVYTFDATQEDVNHWDAQGMELISNRMMFACGMSCESTLSSAWHPEQGCYSAGCEPAIQSVSQFTLNDNDPYDGVVTIQNTTTKVTGDTIPCGECATLDFVANGVLYQTVETLTGSRANNSDNITTFQLGSFNILDELGIDTLVDCVGGSNIEIPNSLGTKLGEELQISDIINLQIIVRTGGTCDLNPIGTCGLNTNPDNFINICLEQELMIDTVYGVAGTEIDTVITATEDNIQAGDIIYEQVVIEYTNGLIGVVTETTADPNVIQGFVPVANATNLNNNGANVYGGNAITTTQGTFDPNPQDYQISIQYNRQLTCFGTFVSDLDRQPQEEIFNISNGTTGAFELVPVTQLTQENFDNNNIIFTYDGFGNITGINPEFQNVSNGNNNNIFVKLDGNYVEFNYSKRGVSRFGRTILCGCP